MTKIILIDDDLSGSSLLKMFLELEAFQVTIAHNLTDARNSLDEETRLVLLDFHLSRNENGIVLLREIRAGQTNTADNIPVIVASGDDRVSQDALGQGANAFLLKPFTPTDLVIKIRELI